MLTTGTLKCPFKVRSLFIFLFGFDPFLVLVKMLKELSNLSASTVLKNTFTPTQYSATEVSSCNISVNVYPQID